MTKPKTDEVPKTIPAFLRFLLAKIVQNRRWLLLPLWVLLAIIALLLMLTGNSALLPAIYIAL